MGLLWRTASSSGNYSTALAVTGFFRRSLFNWPPNERTRSRGNTAISDCRVGAAARGRSRSDQSTAAIRAIWPGFAPRVEAGRGTGGEDRPETSDHGAVGLSLD